MLSLFQDLFEEYFQFKKDLARQHHFQMSEYERLCKSPAKLTQDMSGSGTRSARRPVRGSACRSACRPRRSVHGLPHLPVGPFHSVADISYLGKKIRLSLSLSLSLSTSMPQVSETTVESRSVCEIEINSLEASLGFGLSPLRIQDIRFMTGPQLDPASDSNPRSFTCYGQWPQKLDATISGISYSRGSGGTLSVGYPQAGGIQASKSWSETVQRPLTCAGLSLKDMEIGIDSENQFVWRYPILRNNDLRHKSATFKNHKGMVAYPTSQPPDSICTKATMTCDINFSCLSWALGHLRGLIPFKTKVRDGNLTYPCRHVRFNVQVNVSPENGGQFSFPGDNECGGSLDLGEYHFSNTNGVLVLEIERKNGVPPYVMEPQRPVASATQGEETFTIDFFDNLQTIKFQQGTGQEVSRHLKSSLELTRQKRVH